MVKKIIIFVFCLGILLILIANLFLGVEQKNFLFPYIDTHFAKDFSIDNWDNVRVGMNKDSVIKILGEPLLTSRAKYATNRPPCATFEMHYSGDGAWKYGDYAWCSFALFFDDSNNVIAKSREWFFD
jgi:hypothetical protein